MLKILLVLLPLAASAACSYSDPSTCTKCGVGAIGMQFDYSTPCKCNDNAGRYGEMCPKTGAPAKPTCCSVDGKAATLQSCKCGTTTCQANQMCTAATNKCVYPVCAKTDGSAASTSEKGCQCGDNACSKGQKCTASSSTCANPPTPTCGSGASTVSLCKCGTKTCYRGDTCTASTNTCKSPTVAPATAPAACKEDVVVTAVCTCGGRTAAIGQTCPSTGANKGVAQWPACGSDVFKTKKQACKCTDNICQYGQKCTQAGDFKGICECVASDDVVCVEKVPPSDKCPKTCDGHTAMGATTYVLGQCSVTGLAGYWQMYSAANNVFSNGYYTDSACTAKVPASTVASFNGGAATEWQAGCQSSKSTFYSVPAAASGSTALQVAMPVALVAGLLGFILL